MTTETATSIVFYSPTVTFKVVDGRTTTRSTHATARSAEIYAATETLRANGWKVRGPASGEGYRRPLSLKGEQMVRPLCGSRCDERAQGLTATKGNSVLRVDASAGLPLVYLLNEGDTEDAVAIVESFLA